MELDNTRIVIRERGLLESLDLGLHVLREFAAPWFYYSLLAVVPLSIVNYLLLGWMVDPEYHDYTEVQQYELPFQLLEVIYYFAPWRFVRHLALLTYIEAPLASIFVTTFLGQAVFMQKPTFRQILKDVYKGLPALLLCQFLLRGVAAAWLVLLFSDRYAGFDFPEFLLWVIALVSMGVRAFRPYINEIILLEKNPIRSKITGAITIGKRSSQLHGQSAGDLFLRWMFATILGFMLALLLVVAAHYGVGLLISRYDTTWYHMVFLFPAAFWLIAAFFSVVRYLEYLDLRIRHEGWEVELLMRAERDRLVGKIW